MFLNGHKPKKSDNFKIWIDVKCNTVTDVKKMYVGDMDRNMMTTAVAH